MQAFVVLLATDCVVRQSFGLDMVRRRLLGQVAEEHSAEHWIDQQHERRFQAEVVREVFYVLRKVSSLLP